MTLRRVDGKPVGLDWGVCNDGSNDTSVWSETPPKKQKSASRFPDKQEQIKNRADSQRLAVEIEQEIIAMYRDEMMGGSEIARNLNVSHQTVYKVLRRNNIQVRPKSEAKKLQFERKKNEQP